MDVRQDRRQFSEDADGRGTVVHSQSAAEPVGAADRPADVAPDNQFAIERDIGVGEDSGDRSVGVTVGEIEDRFDFCGVCAGPDHLDVRRCAERESQGLDQDALACPGLTGNDCESAAEVQVDAVGQREVTQLQADQHRRSPYVPSDASMSWSTCSA